MNLTFINELSLPDAQEQFHRCCGSRRFSEELARRRPFASDEDAKKKASEVWFSLSEADWLEAFAHHPRIGEKQLAEKFASTAAWASSEQAGARQASPETIRQLAHGNIAYEQKFGFVFLICATGKNADELLVAQNSRIGNSRAEELQSAAREQDLITHLRLEKIASD